MSNGATPIPTSEAARRTGVSVRTFIRWKEDERIVPVQKLPGLRGAYLFDPTDVESLKSAPTAGVSSPPTIPPIGSGGSSTSTDAA